MFLFTQDIKILFRPFSTSGSVLMGIIVTFIYVTINMPSVKICGCIKARYFAFYIFLIDAFVSLSSMRCDTLLSSFFGFVITYSYFRYIRRKRNQNGTISSGTKRGDPQFKLESLIPFLDQTGNNENNDENNDDSHTNNLFSGTPHRL